MRFVRLYARGSTVMGALLVLDCLWLLLRPAGPVTLVFAALEYLWFFLSIAALVVMVRRDLPILVPVSYVGYTMLSWVHALYMLIVLPEPPPGFELVLPHWLVAVYGGFGLFLLAASLRLGRTLVDPAPTA